MRNPYRWTSATKTSDFIDFLDYYPFKRKSPSNPGSLISGNIIKEVHLFMKKIQAKRVKIFLLVFLFYEISSQFTVAISYSCVQVGSNRFCVFLQEWLRNTQPKHAMDTEKSTTLRQIFLTSHGLNANNWNYKSTIPWWKRRISSSINCLQKRSWIVTERNR